MENKELIPHLFRTEYRKIIAVLCKRFGFSQIEIAEDITSETFLTAMQAWGVEGLPNNPTAWLYNVAKKKAINYLSRATLYNTKVVQELNGTHITSELTDIDLSKHNITDSQLQMMFAICSPRISPEAQIALSLRLLCGFGIDEIASAFLSNKETINKRLYRAKEILKAERMDLSIPGPAQLKDRLDTVLSTLYLLFNEGYYSASQDKLLRKELCFEAMRLAGMLIENKSTNRPEVNALMALMCFHASRFDARQMENGELILYEEQETSNWNQDLIAKGAYFLKSASIGNTLSKYHIEAGIAYWHTIKMDTPEKWENILQLYDQLLIIEHSPVVMLNRIYVLSKLKGKAYAIKELEKMAMDKNHLYHLLLGELYMNVDNIKAKMHCTSALSLTKSIAEKTLIKKKINSIA